MREAESEQIARLVAGVLPVRTSALVLTEFHSILHKRVNVSRMTPGEARIVSASFLSHVADGLWELLPVSEQLLRRTSAIIQAVPAGVNIRAADAIHLVSAAEAGEKDIWTSDRSMLKFAGNFGLTGRTV